MDLSERVRDIITQPVEAWKEIGSERTGVREIFLYYACILAAVPALAYLIGMTVVGLTFLGIRYRAPILDAIGYAVVYYLSSLISLYVFAVLINRLARRFGGESSIERALKVGVYSSTPYWLAGIFLLVPALSPLVFLFGLYGFYLLYRGLATLIEVPPEYRLVYYLILVGVALLLTALTGLVANVTFPQGKMGIV